MTPQAQIIMLKRVRNARATRLQFEEAEFEQAAATAKDTFLDTLDRNRIAANARYDDLVDMGNAVGPPSHLSRYTAASQEHVEALKGEADAKAKAKLSSDTAALALSQASERHRIARKRHAKTDEVCKLIQQNAAIDESRSSEKEDSGDV